MTSSVSAATINASSCSQSAVQSVVDSAVIGDVVAIPVGSCNWSSSVNIPDSKKMTLKGAGKTATIISKTRSSSSEIYTVINLKKSCSRFTGLGFVNGMIETQGYGEIIGTLCFHALLCLSIPDEARHRFRGKAATPS